MGSDSRTTTGGGGRLRSLLVVGEVATAVLLLFGAGLLLRTLIAVESFDRGYRAESVLTMLVDPLGSSYPTPEKLQQFYDQVEAEVRTVPGVPGRRLVERAAARRLALRRLRADLRDRRRSAGARGAAADHQLSGREPDVLLRRSTCRLSPGRAFDARDTARQPARLHRQRSLRPQPRRPVADRHAGRRSRSPARRRTSRTSARSSAWRSRSRAGRTSRRTSSRSTCRWRRTWSTTSS